MTEESTDKTPPLRADSPASNPAQPIDHISDMYILESLTT